MHIPVGSSWPGPTLVQVPTLPLRLQLLQAPVQASLQQMPATHLSEVHWSLAVHVLPLAFLPTHTPAMQALPAVHSPVPPGVQLVRHPVPVSLQVNGAQSTGAAVGQVPPPSQLAPGVNMLPLHTAARQAPA